MPHHRCSCTTGSTDAVKALLKAGADPNLAAEQGVTPLHAAAETEQPEVVKLLLEVGCTMRPRLLHQPAGQKLLRCSCTATAQDGCPAPSHLQSLLSEEHPSAARCTSGAHPLCVLA